MKKNSVFLILGLITTVLSKYLQFYSSSKIGDVIVLFSGAFFVCSIIFSFPKFNFNYETKKTESVLFLVQSVVVVLLFQIMMIFIVNQYYISLVLLIPILILIKLLIPKWKYLIK